MSQELPTSHEYDQGDKLAKFSDFFTFREVIGAGSFGVCVHVTQKSDDQDYAVKVR
jgi:hypothetical protein